MNAIARFIRTIRWFFLIKLVIALDFIWPSAAFWVGERSGLNTVLMRYLDEREATESHGR